MSQIPARSRGTLKIGVIGAGRLGSALARGLDAAGRRVAAIASRQDGDARTLANKIPGTRVLAASELVERADLVFATVPDAEIPSVASSLPWRDGQAVVHCSGALGLDALEGAAARGARPGCIHPLQSFPSRRGEARRFRGIHCGVEAAGDLGDLLEDIARGLGGLPFRLEGVHRARYHAAAVLASNDVVALAAAAGRVWELAGLPQDIARQALSPLLVGAAENVARLPLDEALTGPVARGDSATLALHLEALADTPDLRDLYDRLTRQLMPLAPAAGANDGGRDPDR